MYTSWPFNNNIRETVLAVAGGLHVYRESVFAIQKISCIFIGLFYENMCSIDRTKTLRKAMLAIKLLNSFFKFIFSLG